MAFFRELNCGKCKTYLVACERTRKALLVDPVKDHVSRYLAALAYFDFRLDTIIDTHTHADHPTGSFVLHTLTDADLVMHRRAPAPLVTRHVEDREVLRIGEMPVTVLYTPGHTPDSVSLYVDGRVLTGDVLLIGGTGRADFAGGDPGEQYDSITQTLFVLPDDTLVYPAHDYRGNTSSTIGEEKRTNPRIAGRTRSEYIALMNGLKFPMPDKIQEVLQPNQTAIDDDRARFPNLAELNKVRQLIAEELRDRMASGDAPLLLDVREAHEYRGELGHIAGAVLIPLKDLAQRAGEIDASKNGDIVAICRSGVRSTTAAAILAGLGFEHVFNLKDGMVGWVDRGYPIER